MGVYNWNLLGTLHKRGLATSHAERDLPQDFFTLEAWTFCRPLSAECRALNRGRVFACVPALVMQGKLIENRRGPNESNREFLRLRGKYGVSLNTWNEIGLRFVRCLRATAMVTSRSYAISVFGRSMMVGRGEGIDVSIDSSFASKRSKHSKDGACTGDRSGTAFWC